ncbi:hypothetical protein OGAPHI_006869 [Ogataea philodendri]|uniref:Uncharacterized protein n=1 Tax=Ogataea philodendri TaxID=1378263 RepID=A0A9P8NUU0_9ASCO|nr:uncharacterized protein OGAPHI_006869 [Ogataea philodendri]KAH3660283.1 hypothetical protein OGAPHI_006869 [Ogataea philodendri]
MFKLRSTVATRGLDSLAIAAKFARYKSEPGTVGTCSWSKTKSGSSSLGSSMNPKKLVSKPMSVSLSDVSGSKTVCSTDTFSEPLGVADHECHHQLVDQRFHKRGLSVGIFLQQAVELVVEEVQLLVLCLLVHGDQLERVLGIWLHKERDQRVESGRRGRRLQNVLDAPHLVQLVVDDLHDHAVEDVELARQVDVHQRLEHLRNHRGVQVGLCPGQSQKTTQNVQKRRN